MPKGSDLFVAALENEGVDRIFGVPGEENLDIVESLRTSRIELVLTRHEQAAAFMAATYGRLTGRPGVCLATLGPGALNLATGAAYAHLGAMPMILITGQKPVMSAKQARFQIVDIVASMKPLTKMTHRILSPTAIPATVRDAFRVAEEERPGPVHLELPEDVAAADAGNVDGGSNLYVGTAALSEGDYVHEAIEWADLIIAIGHDTIEKPPFLMKSEGGPKVVHVGYESATVEQVYHPDFEVIGDIGASVTGLAERLEGSISPDAGMPELRQRILAKLNDRAEEDRFPITPQRIVHDVRQVMPEDGIVCLDNGMYKIWFARNYRTHVANTLLLDNALATMGAGLPSAIMASMIYPDRRVMAVCGDGGFMMNSQEMETAVRLGLNLVVVILNDSAYGMIRGKQSVDGFPDFGMSFGNPDFVRYAESYGAKGSRISAVEDLVPVLEAAFAGGGVHLVDVPIDYSENTRVLVDELRNRTPDVECS